MIEQVEDINKQIKQKDKHKKQLEEELNELLTERVEVINIHGQMVHDEKHLLEKVDAIYGTAIGVFINENVMKRTDNKFPECFKNLRL